MASSSKQLKKIFLKDPQHQKTMAVILTCLMCLLLFAKVITPTLANLTTLQRQRGNQKFVLKLGGEKLQSLMPLKEEFVRVQSQIEARWKKFFTDEEASLFLKQLNYFTEEAGGKITFIKPIKEDVLAPSDVNDEFVSVYAKSIVQVRYRGDFKSLINFLVSLAKQPKLISIEDFKISLGRQESQDLNVELMLAMYKLSTDRLKEK
ncbi:MAG: type 4a pilus biogenesis protein PilO [Candidatus Omnitrophota bacterium]